MFESIDGRTIHRLSKTSVVAAIAFLFSLIVFGNLTDYGTNFAFVRHVLMMDTTFPDAMIRYRAISSASLHRLGYAVIIGLEIVTTVACWTGTVLMWRRRRDSSARFARAKAVATAGLTLGYLLWQVGLFAIGNEWFGMWMSREWNGVDSIFRFVVMTLGALIYVSLPEGEGRSS